LEADVVLISGIEDLPLANSANNLFDDIEEQRKQETFSRRMIYVALTRCLEECIIYYNQREHPFIAELWAINRRILTERQPTIP
jgi:superfamily I DNA/RNA helicase